MKLVRLWMMASMFLYFSASCIVFVVPAVSVINNVHSSSGVSILRSVLLLAAELSAASTFALTACAIIGGWRTRNRWGIAGSLLSICVPLPVLHWGVSMFWRYLLACLWLCWLFGAIGLFLFLTAGSPHSLIYDLRKNLGRMSQVPCERNEFPPK